MTTPDPKTIFHHLTDLKQRIDGLRTHFYHIESEFCHAFQSLQRKPSHNGFAELNLLGQLLLRYAQLRTEPEFMESLIARVGDLGRLDLEDTRLKPLNFWLIEMSQHEDDARIDDCFATWQSTSKAFLRYIDSESRFVNESLRKLNAMEIGRYSNVAPQHRSDRL